MNEKVARQTSLYFLPWIIISILSLLFLPCVDAVYFLSNFFCLNSKILSPVIGLTFCLVFFVFRLMKGRIWRREIKKKMSTKEKEMNFFFDLLRFSISIPVFHRFQSIRWMNRKKGEGRRRRIMNHKLVIRVHSVCVCECVSKSI